MKKLVVLSILFLILAYMPLYGNTSLSNIESKLSNSNINSSEEASGSIRNTSFVVLRKEPSLESEKVAVLSFDIKLKLIEKTGDWVKVSCKLGTGYMRSWYYNENLRQGWEKEKGFDKASSSNIPTPKADIPNNSGPLKATDFGYSAQYQPVYDIVAKFCQANSGYVLAKGHKWENGYASRTDCSGFTGSFYQKLAATSGVQPVFRKDSWYPTSQVYKGKFTKKITSEFPPPNPRDKIKPGDIFILNKAGHSYGHIGVFMGYDRSGNPLIAHSTTSRVKSSTKVMGKNGSTGVRIEVLPRRYRNRWSGIYRIDRTDTMLKTLAKKNG